MENNRTDISQIRKYLNGELDARAMHQLEREAQDDPFLMDALEGYETAGSDQQENIGRLLKDLKGRTNKPVRRIIPWTTISIAATIVGFLIVVGLLFKSNKLEKATPQTAQLQPVESVPVAKDSVPAEIKEDEQQLAATTPRTKTFNAPSADVNAERNTVEDEHIAEPSKLNEVETAVADTSPLADKAIIGYMARQKTDSVSMPKNVAVKKPAYSQVLAAKTDGVSTTQAPGKRYDGSVNGVPIGQLAGVVVNRTNGEPLPGVTVKLDGKAKATQTDVNGKFTLSGVTDKDVVSFGYVGFDGKKVKVNPDDSLKVALNEALSSLSEVVVIRPSKAHPLKGWDQFNQYLQKGAVVPAGAKAGTVQLKFTVNPDGSITNIAVVKSLSKPANEQAVSFIRNGPQWVGNSNGKAEVVTVKVEFVHSK